jgi:tRNA(Ile)-lysidine synthase
MSRVVVLLSGGRDSVCLLDTLLAAGHEVTALHVDHGLRDAAADDEAFCRELCARLGVPLEVRHAGGPPAGNVQAWARELRYAAAFELAERLDADVATGHTATDQVETVLYRLAASPGRRALLGMREREGRLVRPLLGMTREDTAAHCRARGLPWREDASNQDPAYARNRARAGLVPALRELHPAAEANVLRTLELLRDEAEVLDAVVDDALAAAGGRVEALAALAPALRRLVFQRLVDAAGGPAAADRVDEALALAPAGGSAALDLGGGVRAVVEYGVLRIAGPAAAAAGEHLDAGPARLPCPGALAWGGGELTCERGPALPVADGTLDAAACAGGLQVRPWRAGDRMRPLGLGGSRSLHDLFTDRKVPRERRARLPVVCCGGEIAWVPGVATGEAFRVSGATGEALRLQWHE